MRSSGLCEAPAPPHVAVPAATQPLQPGRAVAHPSAPGGIANSNFGSVSATAAEAFRVATIEQLSPAATMSSFFRSKKLDIGSFLNIKVIRDHTKRKAFAEFEPERCVTSPTPPQKRARAAVSKPQLLTLARASVTDKLSATSSATRPSPRGRGPRPSCS